MVACKVAHDAVMRKPPLYKAGFTAMVSAGHAVYMDSVGMIPPLRVALHAVTNRSVGPPVTLRRKLRSPESLPWVFGAAMVLPCTVSPQTTST